MRNMVLSALALAMLSIPSMAAPINFNLTDLVYQNGTSLTGTVSIDPATGTFGTINASLTTSAGDTYALNGPLHQASLFYPQMIQYATINFDNNINNIVFISIPALSLIDYSGSNLCVAATCVSSYISFVETGNAFDHLLSGSLLPAAPAPEPSSLALLGTGVLGLGGIVRRRFAAIA